MGSIDFLLDTDVLIRAWRGDSKLKAKLDTYNAGVDTVARLEFLQGANKRQESAALEFVDRFEFIPFSPEVSFKADYLIRKFSHLNGLRLGDALIASTALVFELPLYSFNKRHFEFIEGIKLI